MSTKLGSMTVGSTVKLNIGGSPRDWLVVHQGLPSSMYDSSCNGTWLLLKDIYSERTNSKGNDYETCPVHNFINGEFLNLFDNNIKNAIRQVKIPYWEGRGDEGPVMSGANGLSCKLFLLSAKELGTPYSIDDGFPQDGAKLAYFPQTPQTDKRIAYLNGVLRSWWTRTPNTKVTDSINNCSYSFLVGLTGGIAPNYCNISSGVRPALILDPSLSVADDGSVRTNQPPTTPSSITVPASIMGGTTVTVSWGKATDADGNFAGYKVERSTNGGSSWAQIYQGTETSTTNNVAFGTSSAMYRVKAYDDAGEESAYKTSSQVMVVNNTAPAAPASISVPKEVKGGGSLVISWSAATDADGNLSGYKLERSVNGGEYSEIYGGEYTSYTDTITKGWNKVQYRVKAYDHYTSSGYTTSTERTVDNNTAPAITCDYKDKQSLGTKTNGFTVAYSATDADTTDSVTVTEKMDGVVKRTFTATKGQNNNFAVTGEYFMKLANGDHTMVIEASDGQKIAALTLTFVKRVVKAVITLGTPMDADAKISICAITVNGSIPNDAEYKVEVTNNAKDDSPVWEDCTQECKNGNNYPFQNKTAVNGFAFNFRVAAERGDSDVGGYITSIQGGFQ